MMATATLTPMQAQFAVEYLIDGNGKQAAIRAGCSPRSAEVTASKWLRLAKVKAAVAKGQERQLKRAEQRQDDVCDRMRTLAYADRTQAFDPDGDVKPLSAWPPELRYALDSFKVMRRNVAAGDGHTDTIWEPKFVSKLGAHVEVAKMEGRYVLVADRGMGDGEFEHSKEHQPAAAGAAAVAPRHELVEISGQVRVAH